ncbi:MAG TPA: flavocytochrome c [Christensenellaceae bacterium]|nr:flavocytochrome c [Christensenellaceae bacterium]
MKKITAILMSLVMLMGIVPAFASVSGEFKGTAQGFADEVTVTLTLEDSIIKMVEAEGAGETAGIGTKALEIIPLEMAETGSITADSVSGATITSDAIFEAAKNALENANLNPDDYLKAASGDAEYSKEESELSCDVLVIGAGGAGMTAAIVAADAGKNVILLESQAMVGGNTVRATGGMNAANTPQQDENKFEQSAGVERTLERAKNEFADNAHITELAKTVQKQWEEYQAKPEGYFDSSELMQLDAMIGGRGINNAELVKIFADSSAEAVAWLGENNAPLISVSSLGGASVRRAHRPLGDDGRTIPIGSYLVPRLEENVVNRNVNLMLDTDATSLIFEDGKVVGAKATGKNGFELTIKAPAVVLATGGFGANLDMVVKYKPELKGFMTTNAPGLQGTGIKMAQEVGAAVVDMNEIQIHPTVQFDTSALITEGLRGDGAILVNSNGERFVDEVGTRDVVSAAEIAQPGSFSYLIVDGAMAEASSVIEGYIKKGFTIGGGDLADLAEKLNINPDKLSDTISTWNESVKNKEDKLFGRTNFANPLEKEPYYAVKVTAGIHHTMGGLVIDDNARVLSESGEIIPGLFACGEVTGGIHGGNRLGGNAVTDIIVFGIIAGNAAAESVK